MLLQLKRKKKQKILCNVLLRNLEKNNVWSHNQNGYGAKEDLEFIAQRYHIKSEDLKREIMAQVNQLLMFMEERDYTRSRGSLSCHGTHR